ncbi:MAG TPA: hypothetical protein V6D19_12900 [Stenomitos sp.]
MKAKAIHAIGAMALMTTVGLGSSLSKVQAATTKEGLLLKSEGQSLTYGMLQPTNHLLAQAGVQNQPARVQDNSQPQGQGDNTSQPGNQPQRQIDRQDPTDGPQRPFNNRRQNDIDRSQQPFNNRDVQRDATDRPQRPFNNRDAQRDATDRPQRPFNNRDAQRDATDQPQRPFNNRDVDRDATVRPQQPFNNRRQQDATDQFQRQREAWRQRLEREREARLRQDRIFNQRLNDLTERQRQIYRNYYGYRTHDYWSDRNWRDRNYYRDRAFWSGPGYWYERDYWSGRGYIWNDLITGLVGGLVGGIGGGGGYYGGYPSAYRYPRASTLYTYGPQILAYNRLSETACEPGTVVILLPNRRVMCAYPTTRYVPGVYQVSGNYLITPARVVY